MEERQIPNRHQSYCVRNLNNLLVLLTATFILAFGACTNGNNLKGKIPPESNPGHGAKKNDSRGVERIKDAHNYYTSRGDTLEEAFIEIIIDKPEHLIPGSAFRILYNPLPIYSNQSNGLITIDSFSFSPSTKRYIRPINQSPPGFYRIEHDDLGRYEALVTDSTTIQFRQVESTRLRVVSKGPTSDYLEIVRAIQQASVEQDLEKFKDSYPQITAAAHNVLKSKSSNVYLEFFMALFDRMDGASSKSIQSIMNGMDNVDYKQALIYYRSVPYDFTLPDPEGRPVSLSNYTGQVVLLDFWASWCRPCREENPNLVRLYNTFNDEGFEIVSVSLDNVRDRWTQAIIDDNLTWKGHCSDFKVWNSDLSIMYGISEIPASLLIGRDGFIIWTSSNADKTLEEAIQEAL